MKSLTEDSYRKSNYMTHDVTGIDHISDPESLVRWLMYASSDRNVFTDSLRILRQVIKWIHEECEREPSHALHLRKQHHAELISLFYAVKLLFTKTSGYIARVAKKKEACVAYHIELPLYRFYFEVASTCCKALERILRSLGTMKKLSREGLHTYLHTYKRLYFKEEEEEQLPPTRITDGGTFISVFNQFLDSYSPLSDQERNGSCVEHGEDQRRENSDALTLWVRIFETMREVCKVLVIFWNMSDRGWACRLTQPEIYVDARDFSVQQRTSVFHLFRGIHALLSFVCATILQIFETVMDDNEAEGKECTPQLTTCVVWDGFVLEVLDALIRCSTSPTSLLQRDGFCNSRLCSQVLCQMYTLLLYCLYMKSFTTATFATRETLFIDMLNLALLPLWTSQCISLHPLSLCEEATDAIVNGLVVFVELLNFLIVHRRCQQGPLHNTVGCEAWDERMLVFLWDSPMSGLACVTGTQPFMQTLAMSHITLCLNFILACTKQMGFTTVCTESKPSQQCSPTVKTATSPKIECVDQHRCIKDGIPTAIYAVFLYINCLVPDLVLYPHVKRELSALKVRLVDEWVAAPKKKTNNNMMMKDHHHSYVDFGVLVNYIDNLLTDNPVLPV